MKNKASIIKKSHIKQMILESYAEKVKTDVKEDSNDTQGELDLLKKEIKKFIENSNYTKDQFVKIIKDTFGTFDVSEDMYQGKNNVDAYKKAAQTAGVSSDDQNKGVKALQKGQSVNVSETKKLKKVVTKVK